MTRDLGAEVASEVRALETQRLKIPIRWRVHLSVWRFNIRYEIFDPKRYPVLYNRLTKLYVQII